MLALGGATFDDSSATRIAGAGALRGRRLACGSFATLRFDTLPASAGEAEFVARSWSSSDAAVLTGTQANEAAFKQRAPGRRVLHLATHGFVLGEDCASSEQDEPSPGESPLLRAGLALAGANKRALAGPEEEDGILTGEEVVALDLGGVEWAVLSACDTGLGDVRAGEGVLGLRRAFQLAGARTVIMSLWPVEDEATTRWMSALYAGRFGRGLDTAQAVHEASLSNLRALRERGANTHPGFWAGFVAAGDWR
jgi:CHAT domain-containing protein